MRAHGQRVLWEGAWRGDVTLTIEGGRIISLDDDRGADFEAAVIAPGLIDLQYNGGFGVEIGADASATVRVAELLPRTGVTAFLPTLVTAEEADYPRAFAAFAEARRARARGARPLGLHVEGPFLAPDYAGAHDRLRVERAGAELFEAIASAEEVTMVTLAPERPGALARIAKLAAREVVVSLGHTGATYEELRRGIDAGATMVTHVFNAMSPFTHRAPGAVGAALVDERVVCGMIVDGVHSHEAAFRLALRAKGARGLALVTDAMAAAGCGPGEYALSGRPVMVDEASARLEDGTLAGSILELDAAVRNAVRFGAALDEALRMASETPARVLGSSSKGRLAVGMDADLVLLDERLGVRATICEGEPVYDVSASR